MPPAHPAALTTLATQEDYTRPSVNAMSSVESSDEKVSHQPAVPGTAAEGAVAGVVAASQAAASANGQVAAAAVSVPLTSQQGNSQFIQEILCMLIF